jgi:predicted Holliday junction resolvase-like endonuclease
MIQVAIALIILAVLLSIAVITLVVLAAQNGRLQRRLEEVLRQASNREKNAVAKSRIGHVAKITEQFAPLLPGFPSYNVKDVQWVGGAVDMIVWDGLEEGSDVSVVLLDIKTGRASVNARQRKIRDAVKAGRVRFEVFPFRAVQTVGVPQLTDILPGTRTDEGLRVELIEAEDDDPDWEEHIGDNVVFADDPPDA